MTKTYISDEDWTKWKAKRRKTFLGIIIVATVVGIDSTVTMNTLYLYMFKVIQTPHPKLFFGTSKAVYALSSVVCGLLFGRWIDRTRRFKAYTICMLVIQIVGCLLYLVHFSPWFPLVGRLVAGIGDSFMAVAVGEVVRIYDEEESNRKIVWMASIYATAFLAGPSATLLLKNVNFWIASIHIMQLNAPALFMAAVLAVTLIIAVFLIHDCSAEIDLKEYFKQQACKLDTDAFDSEPKLSGADTRLPIHSEIEKQDIHENAVKNNENDNDDDDDDEKAVDNSIYMVMRKLASNVDTRLLYISTFVFNYILYGINIVMLPIFVNDVLLWPLNGLSYTMIGIGGLQILVSICVSQFFTSNKSIYILSIVSIVACIGVILLLVCMKFLRRNMERDVGLIAVFVLCCDLGWLVEEVLMRCMLAKMVPSKCQSFAESLRNGFSRTATVFGTLTAPLVIPFLEWWSSALVGLSFVILLFFLGRKNSLIDIKEIDFDDVEYKLIAAED